jgi:hypothetical protein
LWAFEAPLILRGAIFIPLTIIPSNGKPPSKLPVVHYDQRVLLVVELQLQLLAHRLALIEGFCMISAYVRCTLVVEAPNRRIPH